VAAASWVSLPEKETNWTISLPVEVSHIRTVLSMAPEITRRPSGLKLTE
jgi:hypothetical protein